MSDSVPTVTDTVTWARYTKAMTDQMAHFAGAAMALYAAHHVGDYWVQTHGQAMRKGAAGRIGRIACTSHVLTYVLTQWVFLTALELTTRHTLIDWRGVIALAVSGVTHWTADRREHGALYWLAARMPWKRGFLTLDSGRLASGAWALDQSWHVFWGVFVAALVIAS